MMDQTVRIARAKDFHYNWIFINGDIVIPFDSFVKSSIMVNLYVDGSHTPVSLLLSKADEFKALWEAIQ